jgi:hypothetical protein
MSEKSWVSLDWGSSRVLGAIPPNVVKRESGDSHVPRLWLQHDEVWSTVTWPVLYKYEMRLGQHHNHSCVLTILLFCSSKPLPILFLT